MDVEKIQKLKYTIAIGLKKDRTVPKDILPAVRRYLENHPEIKTLREMFFSLVRNADK